MEQDTKKHVALLANGISSNPYSCVQKEIDSEAIKGLFWPRLCSMNEAFQMHNIRLILVCEKTCHNYRNWA